MSDLRSECGDRILRSDVIRDPTSSADPDPAPSIANSKIRLRIRIRRIFNSKIRIWIRVQALIKEARGVSLKWIWTNLSKTS